MYDILPMFGVLLLLFPNGPVYQISNFIVHKPLSEKKDHLKAIDRKVISC